MEEKKKTTKKNNSTKKSETKLVSKKNIESKPTKTKTSPSGKSIEKKSKSNEKKPVSSKSTSTSKTKKDLSQKADKAGKKNVKKNENNNKPTLTKKIVKENTSKLKKINEEKTDTTKKSSKVKKDSKVSSKITEKTSAKEKKKTKKDENKTLEKETPKKVQSQKESKKVENENINEIKEEKTILDEPSIDTETQDYLSRTMRLERTMIFDGTQSKNLEEVVEKLSEDNVVLRDKVIKRNPFNRNMIIILIVAMIIVFVSCTGYIIYFTQNTQKEEVSTPTFNSDNYNKTEKIENQSSNGNSTESDSSTSSTDTAFEEINYSNIQTITIDELEQKINNKDNFITIISSQTCYYCITFEPIANEVFKEKNKILYRLNITNMTQDETNRLREYYPFTSTPTILAIKEGAVSTLLEGLQDENSFSTWVDNNSY